MGPQDKPDEVKKPEAKAASSSQRFEAELAGMTPRSVQLDRDRLMFLAGQASLSSTPVHRAGRSWAWPTAFSAMAALAASLLVMLAVRPEPRVVERVVQVPIMAQQEPSGLSTNGPSQSEPSARQPVGDGLAAESGHRPPSDKSLAGASYLDLRDQVLAMGVESWQGDNEARTAGNGEPPVGYHQLLDSLLHDG